MAVRTPWLRVHGRRVPWLPIAGVLFIALLGVVAAAAPWLAPQDPIRQSLRGRLSPPTIEGADGRSHLFGTDHLGRDVLSRVVYGSRASLAVGLISAFLALLAGGTLGLLAGYFRGRLESLTMAAMDVLLAFPPLVLALAIIAYLGQDMVNLTLTLALLSVPASTRVARASTLAIAEREFVVAARALGASHLRVMLRELLPNVVLPLLVYTLILVAVLIVGEGVLSFLGLGVPPPMASWGSMMSEGREQLDVAPHIAFIPATVMFLTVLSFNLVGDTLRSMTDPRRAAL